MENPIWLARCLGLLLRPVFGARPCSTLGGALRLVHTSLLGGAKNVGHDRGFWRNHDKR